MFRAPHGSSSSPVRPPRPPDAVLPPPPFSPRDPPSGHRYNIELRGFFVPVSSKFLFLFCMKKSLLDGLLRYNREHNYDLLRGKKDTNGIIRLVRIFDGLPRLPKPGL